MFSSAALSPLFLSCAPVFLASSCAHLFSACAFYEMYPLIPVSTLSFRSGNSSAFHLSPLMCALPCMKESGGGWNGHYVIFCKSISEFLRIEREEGGERGRWDQQGNYCWIRFYFIVLGVIFRLDGLGASCFGWIGNPTFPSLYVVFRSTGNLYIFYFPIDWGRERRKEGRKVHLWKCLGSFS